MCKKPIILIVVVVLSKEPEEVLQPISLRLWTDASTVRIYHYFCTLDALKLWMKKKKKKEHLMLPQQKIGQLGHFRKPSLSIKKLKKMIMDRKTTY